MNNKKGFTLLELLAVISIIAVIMLLLIPGVQTLTDNTRQSLRDSKIKTLVSAGEKYGNAYINTYQKCVSSLSSNELASCAVDVNTLVQDGYMESDNEDKDSVVDPTTSSNFTGKILLCYNPSDINIYATYVEEGDSYSCPSISTTGNTALNLSSTSGVGYVGGEPIVVNIIKVGTFKSITCASNNSNVATASCQDSQKLTISINKNTSIPAEATITVQGQTEDGNVLSKAYKLSVESASFGIESEENNTCMETGTIKEINFTGTNFGQITITNQSNPENSLDGFINNGKLYLSAGNTVGNGKLLIHEANSNKTIEINKYIYNLRLAPFETNISVNNDGFTYTSARVLLDGLDSVTIQSSNPNVLGIYESAARERNPLTITGGTSGYKRFIIGGKSVGTADIIITGTKNGVECGSLKQTINVSNITLGANTATLYKGGPNFTTSIDSDNRYLSCSSSDTSVATCSINNNELIVSPGNTAKNNVTITVINEIGGRATMTVNVLEAAISLEDNNGQSLSNRTVCREINSNTNSTEVNVIGEDLSHVEIGEFDNGDDWYLVIPELKNNNSIVQVTPREFNLSEYCGGTPNCQTAYNNGRNTGRAKISVLETGANGKIDFYYNIYSLTLSESSGTAYVGGTKTFTVTSKAAGTITATSSNTSVATVTVTPNFTNYNYETPNAENKYTVTITGVAAGQATITITGAECGSTTYSVTVTRQADTTPPSCHFNDSSDATIGFSINDINNATPTLTLSCTDTESGIQNPDAVSTNSFSTNNSNIVSILSVSSPTSIENGYSYEVTIKLSDYGTYNVSFNGNVIKNGDGLYNTKTTSAKYIGSETRYVSAWQIGKTNRQDVTAILYDNHVLNNGTANTYTLKIYGKGDMLNFTYSTATGGGWQYAPWYSYRDKITNVVIGNNVTNVGDYACYNCTNLTSVTLSNSTSTIGSYAFSDVPITSLTIPASVSSIKSYAFRNNKITSLTIPSNVEEIQERAFYSTNGTLTSLTFASDTKLKEISNYAFYGHMLTSLTIPANIETIGYRSFDKYYSYDSTLSTLTFANGTKLKTIGDSAFYDSVITSLTIPASVETIGSYAFGGGEKITSLTFAGNNITTIDDGAFNSAKLTSITIPSSVQTIGRYAFGDSNFTSISFANNSNITTIDDGAFSSAKVSSLSLPNSLKIIGDETFGDQTRLTTFNVGPNVEEIGDKFISGDRLRAITVDSNNQHFSSVDGVLYNKNQTILIRCPDYIVGTTSTINVPSTVTEFRPHSFSGWLWYGSPSNAYTINIPSGIVNLNESNNFYHTTVRRFNMTTGNSTYSTNEGVLFSGDGTTLLKIPSSYGKSSYTIPNTTTTLANSCGEDQVSISTLTIPASVTKIGSYAFYADTSENGYKTIYLNVNDDTEIKNSSFYLSHDFASETRTLSRTIYVKTNTMQTKLEGMLNGRDYESYTVRVN